MSLYPIKQYIVERESEQGQDSGSSPAAASNKYLTLVGSFHELGQEFLTIK